MLLTPLIRTEINVTPLLFNERAASSIKEVKGGKELQNKLKSQSVRGFLRAVNGGTHQV